MITFSYTPVGGTGTTTVTLLESDRLWPARLDFGGEGELQVVGYPRAMSERVFGRGNALVPISFTAQRQHATLAAAITYLGITVPAMLGCTGILTFNLPGGGRLRSVNCGCKSAHGHNLNVRSYVDFTFIGPKPTA